MDVGASTMEGLGIKFKCMNPRVALVLLGALLSVACASKVLKYKDAEKLKENTEFEQSVVIVVAEESKSLPPTADQVLLPEATATTTTTLAPRPKKEARKPKKEDLKKTTTTVSARRQPDLESDVGFQGRRPIKDPFRVGEKVTHRVSYFNVTAGDMILEVRPFAQVNGRKSYNFAIGIKSSPLFSSFYTADDLATTMLDFETMSPSVFALHVKESAQLREARAIFDFDANTAKFWEKKVTSSAGEQEKKLEWEILPFSQNVYSTAFYMRAFFWDVGVENSFRVAHDGENLVFKGKCIRKEKIKIDAGEFDALVIKPEVTLKGVFRPTGDVYIWLSNDDRKYVLKIEAKIKIGTLVSEAKSIEPGLP